MKFGLLLTIGLGFFTSSVFANFNGDPELLAITLNFDKLNPTCFGYTNGTATVNPSGGTAPYAYTWDNGQHGQTNQGLGAGTYYVTVVDALGESQTGSVSLSAPDLLVVTINSVQVGCVGYSGELTATVTGGTAPYNYAWSTGATTATIGNISPNDYHVSISDAQGCLDVETRYVGPASEIFTGYNKTSPKCNGGHDGSIGLNVYGNYPPFTYTWEGGVSNTNLIGVPAGNYDITVSDNNGCTKVEEVILADNPAISLDITVTNILCQMFCDGSVGAVVSGGVGNFTYLWNNGSTAPVLENLPPGWYSVTVSDGNNCTATDSAYIYEPPALEIAFTTTGGSCTAAPGSITAAVSGGTAPYSYHWSNGNTTNTIDNITASGIYNLEVTDANGCKKNKEINFIGNSLDVTLQIGSALCTGVNSGTATAIVTPAGTYNYTWNVPAPNTASINGLAAGTLISVTVTDPVTGCQGVASGSVSAHNQIQLGIATTNVNCIGDLTGSATATATLGTPAYSFTWIAPGGGSDVQGPTITGYPAGAYQVSVVDAVGCTATTVANIAANSALNADLAFNMVNCLDGGLVEVQFSDNSTDATSTITNWSWNIVWGTGQVVTTDQNPGSFNVPANETGTVQLTVTSAAGCSDMISEQFTVSALPDVSVDATAPEVVCNGNATTFTITGDTSYTYTWNTTVGLDLTGFPVISANPASSTNYILTVNNNGCTKSIPVNVVVPAPIELSVSPDMTSCNAVEQLIATSNVTNLVWYDSAGDSLGSGNTYMAPTGNGSPLAYQVVATDAYGCTRSEVVNVTSIGVNLALNTTDTVACEGSNIQLSAQSDDPSATFHWYSIPSGLVFTPNNVPNPTVVGAAGNFTVYVVASNQNQCADTLNVNLQYLPGNPIDNATMDLCNGLAVSFDYAGTGAIWNFGDGQTSNEAHVVHTYATYGSYHVTLTPLSGACEAPLDTTILVAPPLDIDMQADRITCINSAIFNFHGIDPSGLVTSWHWDFSGAAPVSSGQNPTVQFNDPGPVLVTVIAADTRGCLDTVQTNLPFHIIDVTGLTDRNFCDNADIALNPGFDPAGVYTWSSTPVDPTLNINDPNPVVSPNVPTDYTVHIVLGGCDTTVTMHITPDFAPNLTGPADQVVCSNDPITVTAVHGTGTLQWADNPAFSPSIAGENFTIDPPVANGVYYVRVTSLLNNCFSQDTFTINNAKLNIAVDPNSPIALCQGESTTLTVENLDPTQNLSYSWSPASGSGNSLEIIPGADTQFTVSISNGLCSETRIFNVDVADVAVQIQTPKDTICPGEVVQLNAAATGGTSYTYQWTPSGNLNDDEIANPTANITEQTMFEVTVTDVSGCTAHATKLVSLMTLQCREPYIYVPNAFTPNDDQNNDVLFVRGLNIKTMSFVVYDRWGEKMFETNDPSIGWDGSYNGRKLTPDSYGWYLNVGCTDGETYKSKGNVTILK